MTNIDKLPSFTVKIEGGSGCLYQPLSNEYSYVLTAKHVINGNNAPIIIRQIIDVNGTLINEPLVIIGEPFLHSDGEKDAAIIKINKVEGIDLLIRDDLSCENKENYYLCGHPNSRINDAYSFRENKLTIENLKQFGYIVSLRKLPIFSIAIHNYIIQANLFGYHACDFHPADALAQFSLPKFEFSL